MPELVAEPEDIILQKLEQLKCSQNCQNIANYLIYGYGNFHSNKGIYCTQCLSQVKDLTPQKIVNFSGLSKILVQLIEQYNKNMKSEVSFAKVAKTETEKGTAEITKLRKNLQFQVSQSRKKTNLILNQAYKDCLQQHRLQPLEALYEPDMTATMIMKQTDLLLKNLEILKISHNQNNEVKYQFVDDTKNPTKVMKNSLKQYLQVENVLKESSQRVKDILAEWRENMKKD